MTTEEAIKEFKNYFPDDVEAIVLRKEYYAKELGQLQFENIILKDRIDKAIKLLELTEARKKVCTDFVNVGRKRYDEILNILKGGNNE